MVEEQLFLKINHYCNINCYNHNIYDNNDNNNINNSDNNNNNNNRYDNNIKNNNIITVFKSREQKEVKIFYLFRTL